MIKLNEHVLDFKTYPNNESVLIDLIHPFLNEYTMNTVSLYFENEVELTRLMLLKGWLEDVTDNKIKLYLPYVPYSRMDRSESRSSFTLKYFCNFINYLDFDEVFIREAHSYMTQALLKNTTHYETTPLIARKAMLELNFTKLDYILYPDAGAQKRYSKLFEGFNVLVANKIRDFETGEITGLEIQGCNDLNNGRVMIVDDLCSAGGSFYYSALALKKVNAGDIYLSVTHCEDTIHKGKLLDGDEVKRIYTTNSILTIPHDKISIREA